MYVSNGAIYASDRGRFMPTTGCDVCQRQGAIYASDRNRYGSGRRQTAGFIRPHNDGGLEQAVTVYDK